jgi:hypothetical protein
VMWGLRPGWPEAGLRVEPAWGGQLALGLWS